MNQRLNSLLYRIAIYIPAIATLACLYACSDSANSSHDGELEKASLEFTRLISSGRMASVDSLINAEREAAAEKGDSDIWCNSKVHQAVACYYLSQPDGMLVNIDSAMTYLTRKPSTHSRDMMLQKVLQAKGTVYSQHYYNPDSAIYYLQRGADVAERTGDLKAYALALSNVADAYKSDSRLDKAADLYHKAILVADSAGFRPEDYISLYGGLATVYTGLRDFENSAVWWNKTMELWPRMIPFEKFNNLNNYGNDFYFRRDYKGALDVFLRLDAYLDSLGNPEWEKNFVAINLSDCRLRMNQPDSINEILPRALQYFTEVQPNPVAVSYAHTLQMRQAWMKGERAETDRLISEHPWSDTLRPEMSLLRLEVLSGYYGDTGRPDEALKWSELYHALNDSLRSLAVNQNIAARRYGYQRDTEVLRLRTENAEKNQKILRQTVIIVAVIAILLIIVFAAILFRRKAMRREERMLDKIATLRADSCRQRITPHFIYNALNHEIMNRASGAESRLDDIVRLLRQQQFVASELVTTLAAELSFTGSYIAIQSDNYRQRLSYELSIADNLDPEHLRIPSMLIQILVENAFKHAFPRTGAEEMCRLSIRVRQTDETFVCVEVFNSMPASGSGGISDTAGSGTGLRVIIETIRLINRQEQAGIDFNIDFNYHGPLGEGCLASYIIPYRWMQITH